MVHNTVFNIISVISLQVHLSMLSWSSCKLYTIILAAFPHIHCRKKWTVAREEWLSKHPVSSILGRNIGRAGDGTSNLLFSSPQRYRLSCGARHQSLERMGLNQWPPCSKVLYTPNRATQAWQKVQKIQPTMSWCIQSSIRRPILLLNIM